MTEQELILKMRRAVGTYDNELVINVADACVRVAKDYADSLINSKQEDITFMKVSRDANGNSRYVCDYVHFLLPDERIDHKLDPYSVALKRARNLGGKKFHNKQFGGGVVFQTTNPKALQKSIRELMQSYE